MTPRSRLTPVASVEIARLRKHLIAWYKAHGRSFPWREACDPFKLLIAEIMLRRTKANQVKMVYEQLMATYPDAKSLSMAPPMDIRRILTPLGLAWRIPAFCEMVRDIGRRYEFKVPETREELKQLPGVGDYVAGAVLSIGFGHKEWIVDNNIVRLFRRYFGVKTSKEARRDKQIIEMARMYATTKDPRAANLAILDFTAVMCTPRNPRHDDCPVRRYCHSVSR